MGKRARGIERLEAHFQGAAFAPHRHDTYAIGMTLAGVQAFRYRGQQRTCLPGQFHILHPDELHDGAAGTDAGFGYRIIYIDPALVQAAGGGRPLPFAREPVVERAEMPQDVVAAVHDLDDEIDETGIAVAVADMPCSNPGPKATLCLASLNRVRDAIAAMPEVPHSMAVLERVAGLDRWTLARQFRAAFGTSPGRFRTMRQLDLVRRLLRNGAALADAAAAAGFADQSHMTRQFKRAYGLTPACWAAAIA